jgi:hypothetical protein
MWYIIALLATHTQDLKTEASSTWKFVHVFKSGVLWQSLAQLHQDQKASVEHAPEVL